MVDGHTPMTFGLECRRYTIIFNILSWYASNNKANNNITSLTVVYIANVESSSMLAPQGNLHHIVSGWELILDEYIFLHLYRRVVSARCCSL